MAEKDSHYLDEPLKMRQVQFLVTEDCNLSCVYCYEKHKRPRKLSPQVIKEQLYKAMLLDDGHEELSIDFFGGEPLLAFDTIKEVVGWFYTVQWPPSAKRYRFSVTTNGTLFDDDIKAWMVKYKDALTPCVSFDGTRSAHNRNRCGSYDAVVKHVDFLREHWPLQPVKMTISQHTLDAVYDGIVSIHNMGLRVEANVVFENVWGDSEDELDALRVYYKQLEKLVQFYHENPDLKRPYLVSRKIIALFDSGYRYRKYFCGCGEHVTCWTADGVQYPCMRFTPMCTPRPIQDLSMSSDGVNTKCVSCPLERLCPTCEGYNYEATGSCFNRTTFHCDFFRLELLATARLMLLDEGDSLWKPLDPGSEEEANRLRKIVTIRAINDLCEDLIELM